MENIFKNSLSNIVTFLIGVVGSLVSILSIPNDYFILRTILLIFFILLILIGIINSILHKFYIKNSFSILGTCKSIGISKIHTTGISDKNLRQKLKKAHVIKIFSTSGIVLFRSKREELIQALLNNANISVLISTLNSEYLREIEILESELRADTIKPELIQVKGILKECMEYVKKISKNKTTGKITINYFNTQLRLPMIICDDDYGWLTITLAPKRSTESIAFELDKTNTGLLKNCIDHFDAVWERLIKEGQEPEVIQ